MNIRPPRIGPQPWDVVRTKLDQSLPFANMRDTPYYRDAVWEQFSRAEYERRYRALRDKMRAHKLDAVIVPGGPSHWSFGGGMLWLTGHWEWHALSSYVLVPLEGDPTLIYSMGGTHAEAVRRHVDVALKDVRHSRNGRYADVMVERLRELKLERSRIHGMKTIFRSINITFCATTCRTPSWFSRADFCTNCSRSTAPRSWTACERPACCVAMPWTPCSPAPAPA
jgi:hypothetical protein